jgi:nicotinamidase-related amidase
MIATLANHRVKRKITFALVAWLAFATACDRPTDGARIPVYENPQIALVVLDVQKQVVAPSGRGMVAEAQIEPMLAALGKLVDGAKSNGVAVVFVRTDEYDELDPRLSTVGGPVFAKSRRDAFSNAELEQFFRTRSIDHLVLAGASVDGSIAFTSAGARNRGYKVQVVADAVGSSSDARRDRAVRQLRQEGVEIVDTDRVLSEWQRRKQYLSR